MKPGLMRRRILLCGVPILIACNSVLGIDPPTVPPDAGADANVDGGGADAGCAVDQDPCIPFPQCGCGDLNCEVTASDGTTSCSAVTSTPLYANCVGYGSCPKGAECIGGVCKPFCASAADCTGGYRTCEQITSTGKNGGPPVPALKVCSSGCDPIAPLAVCGPDVACFPWPFDGKKKDFGDCFGKVGKGVGPGACSGTNQSDCAPGYYCTQAGDCTQWCRVGHPEDCTTGTCVPFIDVPVSIAGVPYGICQ